MASGRHQSLCGRLWDGYIFQRKFRSQTSDNLERWKAEKRRVEERTRKEIEESRYSARIVLLRFGDVIGCDEWAVPMVICFLCCEIWRWCEIRFSCVPTVLSWVSRPCRELSLPPSICSIGAESTTFMQKVEIHNDNTTATSQSKSDHHSWNAWLRHELPNEDFVVEF